MCLRLPVTYLNGWLDIQKINFSCVKPLCFWDLAITAMNGNTPCESCALGVKPLWSELFRKMGWQKGRRLRVQGAAGGRLFAEEVWRRARGKGPH